MDAREIKERKLKDLKEEIDRVFAELEEDHERKEQLNDQSMSSFNSVFQLSSERRPICLSLGIPARKAEL